MPRSTRSQAITPGLLLRAYAAGLFPMSEGADDPDLFWVEPETRGVIALDGFHVSRKLARLVRSERFAIHVDRDFDGVIAGCAAPAEDRPSTWINGTIRRLYQALFERGFVHTVEAYEDGQLVGGLYGVALAGAFFGESMFHRATDASKVCLTHLVAEMIKGGFALLDTQFVTPHLRSLGATEVPRERYLELLDSALSKLGQFPNDASLLGGAEVLQVLGHA